MRANSNGISTESSYNNLLIGIKTFIIKEKISYNYLKILQNRFFSSSHNYILKHQPPPQITIM